MYHVPTPRPTARQDGSSSLLKYIIGTYTHNTAQGCRVYGTSKISLSSQGRWNDGVETRYTSPTNTTTIRILLRAFILSARDT